jgi:hypothetical protein
LSDAKNAAMNRMTIPEKARGGATRHDQPERYRVTSDKFLRGLFPIMVWQAALLETVSPRHRKELDIWGTEPLYPV